MGVNRTSLLSTLVCAALLTAGAPASAQFESYFAHGAQTSGGYGQPARQAAPAVYEASPANQHAHMARQAQYMQQAQMAAHASSAPGAELPQYPVADGYDQYVGEAHGYGGDSEYCDQCLAAGHGGCFLGCAGPHGPYEDDTCGPRWFDVSADFVYLKREDVSREIIFSRDGLAGPFVLGTNDIEFQEEPGFRVTGRIDLGAASNIEASFLGGFNWSSMAQATSDSDNLYSIMSDFGASPVGGYVETDQAALHRLSYDSQLDSVELLYRRHWISPGMRLQGSWLMGARYMQIDERFGYLTHADLHNDPLNGNNPRGPGDMDYRVNTSNALVGFQLGFDAFVCVLPGLTAGGDIKAGVYNNRARQRTNVTATSVVGEIQETATNDDVAMIAEAGAKVVYQFTPGWSFTGGYQVLFIDGLALAPENFNSNAPFLGPAPPRVVGINDNGNVLYHGFTAGFEWLW